MEAGRLCTATERQKKEERRAAMLLGLVWANAVLFLRSGKLSDDGHALLVTRKTGAKCYGSDWFC